MLATRFPFCRIADSLADFMWLVPAVLSLALVWNHAVGIPYIDQCDGNLPFPMKVAAGEARASDLIDFHMEHRIPRPDVTAKLSNSRFLRAGWGRLFPTRAMPRRPCRIRAWAFNTDDGTTAELDGVVEWRPEG